jgi:hypothetical protein
LLHRGEEKTFEKISRISLEGKWAKHIIAREVDLVKAGRNESLWLIRRISFLKNKLYGI